MFAVDIPNFISPEDIWENIGWFEAEMDAIEYIKNIFGGDENGCICLISEVEEE